MLAYVSLWSADLLALGEAVDRLGEVADGFHLDVFDGHNVPELLFGPTWSPRCGRAPLPCSMSI